MVRACSQGARGSRPQRADRQPGAQHMAVLPLLRAAPSQISGCARCAWLRIDRRLASLLHRLVLASLRVHHVRRWKWTRAMSGIMEWQVGRRVTTRLVQAWQALWSFGGRSGWHFGRRFAAFAPLAGVCYAIHG